MKDLASMVAQLNDITSAIVGRRVRENGYWGDDVGWTGTVQGLNPKGQPLVKWDDGGEINPVNADLLTVLDHEALESRADMEKRINAKFRRLERLSYALARGSITGLIVSGQGGIGKTHTVEKALRDVLGFIEDEEFVPEEGEEIIEGTEPAQKPNYHKVTGHISPLGLYETLYRHSRAEDVVVFDDCDSVFASDLTMNLLKAALDTHPVRVLSWESTSKQMTAPRSFVFRGRVVFLTNKRLNGPHFEALMTRCHGIDLHMNPVELLVRIESIVYNMDYKTATPEHCREVVTWLTENINRFKEISIRTVLKGLDYRLMDDSNPDAIEGEWKELADGMADY